MPKSLAPKIDIRVRLFQLRSRVWEPTGPGGSPGHGPFSECEIRFRPDRVRWEGFYYSMKVKLIVSLLVFIVLLDQISKIVVDRTIPLDQSIPVVDGFFDLTYIRNTGAAFGLFAGGAAFLRLPFLISFSLLAIGFIVVMLRRLPEKEKLLIMALSFILGGAIGNLIDRILYGEVVDFLDFYWSVYHWPAFNVADSFISVGVTLTLFRFIALKGEDPFASSPNDRRD